MFLPVPNVIHFICSNLINRKPKAFTFMQYTSLLGVNKLSNQVTYYGMEPFNLLGTGGTAPLPRYHLYTTSSGFYLRKLIVKH